MFPHISAGDLKNVLRFIYEGEIKIKQCELKSFLQVAKLLKIKGMDFDMGEVPFFYIKLNFTKIKSTN